MAESNSSAVAPGHLDTNIESGKFDEKEPQIGSQGPSKPKAEEDIEDDDEDIDALIEDLESHDGHGQEDEEDETTPGCKHWPPLPSPVARRARSSDRSHQLLPTDLMCVVWASWYQSRRPCFRDCRNVY